MVELLLKRQNSRKYMDMEHLFHEVKVPWHGNVTPSSPQKQIIASVDTVVKQNNVM